MERPLRECSSGPLPWTWKAVAIEPGDQGCARDAEHLRRPALVARAEVECLLDALLLRARLLSQQRRIGGLRIVSTGPWGQGHDVGRRLHRDRDVLGGHLIAGTEDDRPLDDVSELADVARPRMTPERLQRLGGQD